MTLSRTQGSSALVVSAAPLPVNQGVTSQEDPSRDWTSLENPGRPGTFASLAAQRLGNPKSLGEPRNNHLGEFQGCPGPFKGARQTLRSTCQDLIKSCCVSTDSHFWPLSALR